ncbi:MAG: alkaline phosphatase D family protein [Actinomycetota bacterium]|nr:alkaline phosphatase D family protein [Actinomycetota bacterium]
MSRRTFLRLGGIGAAGLMLGAGVSGIEKIVYQPRLSGYPFSLGVASGDPLPDGVVLWTRLALDPMNGGMVTDHAVPVTWRVATDEGMKGVVQSGTVLARPGLAHSVHVEVSGLKPDRWYWYCFEAGKERSPIGRTKTAPVAGSTIDRLAFALASCQQWVGGPYPAYRHMAEEDLDFVVHVGDYIYGERGTRTLADYRRLYALYKTSPDLQAAHVAFPFIATLDDHEVANNWADGSLQDHPDVGEQAFLARRAAAFQAYYEHMPLRRFSRPAGLDMRLYRRFAFGDLAALNVLDTRQYRSAHATGGFIARRHPDSHGPLQEMVGAEQKRWLLKGLADSPARWNILAQQTMMTEYDDRLGAEEYINHDQWDGYTIARNRLFDSIRDHRPANPVVLSGDWHANWVNDLKADFGAPDSETLATEFVGTSISSGLPENVRRRVEAALPENPHVRFFDGDFRGYTRCSVSRELWRTDFRTVEERDDPQSPVSTLASFDVENGRPGARRA